MNETIINLTNKAIGKCIYFCNDNWMVYDVFFIGGGVLVLIILIFWYFKLLGEGK